ncbi:MAG: hypothetical protein K6A30_00565 [Lachnospiraceae bacterium]|nr:hypothetical protein [Lachnospiraceae bacterium]
MTTENLYLLTSQFRCAIEKAKLNHCFEQDLCFRRFPDDCCGEASELLAQFLLEKGVETSLVWGWYPGKNCREREAHAWLQISDGTILDITGDQFKNNPEYGDYDYAAYVGDMDDFHEMFAVEDEDVRKCVRLEELGGAYPRLKDLYKTILAYV